MPAMSGFDYFVQNWSQSLQHNEGFLSLRQELETVFILELPRDLLEFSKLNKSRTIVLLSRSSTYSALQILNRGYNHVLSAERTDLKKEILISCLMIIRPKALIENDVPFFFKGLSKESTGISIENTFLHNVADRQQQFMVLKKLSDFIEKSSQLLSISELALQVAEEILSNAISKKIELSEKKFIHKLHPINFFASFDKDQLLVGCIDYTGTVDRQNTLQSLLVTHSNKMVNSKRSGDHNGLGLKLCVESSAGLYLYSERQKRTVICFSILLNGRRANNLALKHFNIVVE